MYESSAHVDVGGDVYDFMTLDDGRLAVVLGDVTGHGVEATADMAMAKFVFRSLAREHPEPGDFLAHRERRRRRRDRDRASSSRWRISRSTASTARSSCASAGHPAPRLVLPDGTVRGLEASGLVLGIDAGQEYEEVHADLPSGSVLVVYTDGVIEARSDGELYGVERLDALLAANRDARAARARRRRHGELPQLRGRRARRRRRGRRHPPHGVMPFELRRGERGIVRIGHRGAAALAPENSLAAIEAAAGVGVDAVELDVLRRADGILVLGHGPEVPDERTAARRGARRSSAASALRCSST